MPKNPLLTPKKKAKFIDVPHSAGILDDHAVRKVLHTTEFNTAEASIESNDPTGTFIDITNTDATPTVGLRCYDGAGNSIGGFLGNSTTMGFKGSAGIYNQLNLRYDDQISFNKGSNGAYIGLIRSNAFILPNDNQKIYMGAGSDSTIYYNGSDLILSPADVGTGRVLINAGYNRGLEINQGRDDAAFRINGYDDKSGSYAEWHITSAGNTYMQSVGGGFTFSSNGYAINFNAGSTGSGNNVGFKGDSFYFDVGGTWYVRDRDGSYVTRWIMNSSTGDITHYYGDYNLYDNNKLLLGNAGDAGIWYDGTDLNIDPNIVGSGNVKLGGIIDMNTHKVTNVVDPTSDQDAATKKYVDDNIGGGSETKEFFVEGRIDNSTNAGKTIIGDFRVDNQSSSDTLIFQFYLPSDFVTLTEAAIVCIPDATETINIDVNVTFCKVGEAYNANAIGGNDNSTSLTAGVINEVDISGWFSGSPQPAAEDYINVKVDSNMTYFRPFGLRIKYTT